LPWLWMAMRAVCYSPRRAERRGGGWWTRAWSFVFEETVRSSGRKVLRLWRRLPACPQRPACAVGGVLRRWVSLWESGSPGTRGVACPGSARSSRGCGAGESADVLVVGVVERVCRLAAGDEGRPRRCQRSVAEGAAGDLEAEVGGRSHRLAGCLRGRAERPGDGVAGRSWMPRRSPPGGGGRTRIGGWHRQIRSMRVAGNGEGGGRRRDSRRRGHCRTMADTATAGFCGKKGGGGRVNTEWGRASTQRASARMRPQAVDKGGWDRENSAESIVGEADRGGQGLEISNMCWRIGRNSK